MRKRKLLEETNVWQLAEDDTVMLLNALRQHFTHSFKCIRLLQTEMTNCCTLYSSLSQSSYPGGTLEIICRFQGTPA
jgi:hypothetical protein